MPLHMAELKEAMERHQELSDAASIVNDRVKYVEPRGLLALVNVYSYLAKQRDMWAKQLGYQKSL